eukprot:1147181-Pelagomonas_calceolata.AAC.2
MLPCAFRKGPQTCQLRTERRFVQQTRPCVLRKGSLTSQLVPHKETHLPNNSLVEDNTTEQGGTWWAIGHTPVKCLKSCCRAMDSATARQSFCGQARSGSLLMTTSWTNCIQLIGSTMWIVVPPRKVPVHNFE